MTVPSGASCVTESSLKFATQMFVPSLARALGLSSMSNVTAVIGNAGLVELRRGTGVGVGVRGLNIIEAGVGVSKATGVGGSLTSEIGIGTSEASVFSAVGEEVDVPSGSVDSVTQAPDNMRVNTTNSIRT